MRSTSSLAVAASLVLAACGDDTPSPAGVAATGSAVPTWAKVSKEQVAEADKLKVPVAFENSIGMRFVLIPAGKFTMGSPPTEESRDETETAHEATLTKAYYLQTTELTNRQYRKFKADHHCLEQLAGYSIDGDEQPVNQIAWNDAVAFVGWLNDLSQPDPSSLFNLFGLMPWAAPVSGSTLHAVFIGLLPIVLGISMWLQQKLNPAPTDPVQGRILAWMPVVFMFMLGRFASGLVLYWITNNTITFAQQYLIMWSHGKRPDIFGNIRKPKFLAANSGAKPKK